MTLPITLSIAGSDSGGGAGIQADLKTFQAFGTFGTTVITAITAQNTLGVTAIHPVPAEVIHAQIAAVVSDLRPAAFKSGMLATREVITTVASAIGEHRLENYVLDPVMVATSGSRLLEQEAEMGIVQELVPLATLVTPNLDEASILVGSPIRDYAGMRDAAVAIVKLGASAALIKGGHLESEEVVDVLFDGHEWREWRRPKLATTSTHGTGCTLSAAIAAGLAQGRPLSAAVERALDFLQRALATAPGIGSGHGPLNHMVAPELDGPLIG
ncbi:MAG: bifunctional hydroxymethylpyrimidine kinase/phosphomethylpyrimidine kinase [Gemmatimonadota bacterium]